MVGRGEKIRKLLESSIAGGLFPGAVWHVEEKGDVVARGHTGHSQTVPRRSKMSEETLFDLASLTKPIVSGTLALLLRERSQLDISNPVGFYLPKFDVGWKKEVRVSQLLSHYSGLPSGLPLSSLCADKSEVLDRICEAEMAYEPGSRTLYSDVGFILLGILMESICRGNIADLARDMIFHPLGMEHTMYNPPMDARGKIAATQDIPERGGIQVGKVHDGNASFMGGTSGHAGLFSCIDDLATFSRMMLGEGTETGLLEAETIEDATRIWSDDGEDAYGLAWFKRKSPINPAGKMLSPRAYGHTGFTGTSLWMDPDRNLFAILLTNRVHPKGAEEKIPEMNMLRGRFHDISAG
jgi:CubicO group peptidase (beta-lactamase class C family)